MPPPGWTKLDEDVKSVFSPTTRSLKSGALPGAWRPPKTNSRHADLGATHGIGNPIHIYPLYENAFRAHRGQSIAGNNAESAQLYAEYAKVAEGNQYAWNHGVPAETAQSIGTPSKKNRMICLPCMLCVADRSQWYTDEWLDPLLMNAFNNINLAGACIVTSADFARELGVSEDRWIYVLGGAGTRDSNDCNNLQFSLSLGEHYR